MRRGPRGRQRGAALIVAVTFSLVIVGVTGTLVGVTLVSSHGHTERVYKDATRHAADGAVAVALGNMAKSKPVPAAIGGSMATTAASSGYVSGVPWAIRISQGTSDPTLYKVSVAAGNSNEYALRLVFVQVPNTMPPIPNGIGGAITSVDPSWIQAASITVDGTNHNPFGGGLVGSGNSSAVENGGTFTPKGTIIGPVVNGAAVGTNQGQIPNSPARVFDGSVTDAILTTNNPTYFTSQAALTAWIAANKDANGYVPNTSPIYYTFDGLDPTSLPLDPSKAYVVINHRTASGKEPAANNTAGQGIANCGFIAGSFTGVLIVDNFDHMQHGPLVGAVVVLGNYSGMMKIQGNVTVDYSTGAIGLAMQAAFGATTSSTPKVLGYLENPTVADADVVSAIRACGFVVGTSATNAGATPAGWRTPPQ